MFTGGYSGLRQNEAPTINKDSTTLSVFMLYFLEIIYLLVEETNKYYQQYFDIPDRGQSPLPHVTIQKICSFLAIIV
jgi:hypothetical protein